MVQQTSKLTTVLTNCVFGQAKEGTNTQVEADTGTKEADKPSKASIFHALPISFFVKQLAGQ